MNAGGDRADAVFRALADSTRRIILDELKQRDRQTLFEICARLAEKHRSALSRQAVSKHLAILEEADLIRVSWQGRTKIHSLHATPIRSLGRGWLAKYLQKRESRR